MKAILCQAAMIAVLAAATVDPILAQTAATPPNHTPPRRGAFRAPPPPRNPVPILPALPAADDTAFYATNDVPQELYVFSSGYWPDQLPAYRENIQPLLGQTQINEGFRMPVYFGVGEADIAYLNSMRTLAVFNDHGIRTFSVLSSHGHEWLNGRRYLWQTAQIMLPDDH